MVPRGLDPERIARRVDEVTRGFGGDVGIVPRQFLRSLVNLFDVVAENPDEPLPELPPELPMMTAIEERAAAGKKPYEYEPEPGDERGYTASVEF